MTGKEAKVVKAAYESMVKRLLRAACSGPRMDWATWDDMRDRQSKYLRARERPHPRFDEQMAALEGER